MEIDNDLERETFQKQLYFMTEQLKELHAKLDYDIQSRIPLEDLVETANLLASDQNIFAIVRGLREYQNKLEDCLKEQRDEEVLKHQKEIEEYTRILSESELSHTVALAKLQHDKKMKEMDRMIMEKLDETTEEQQQTLQLLKVPGFYVSKENKVIVTQMHLLSFLLKLQKILENQK